MARIQFLGAAGTVTGSKYLVDTGSVRFLVDCGMYQGAKELRLMNWSPPPVPPPSIGQILVTHAHIDHIGLLPIFVRDGFHGPVWSTPATVELTGISLRDSAHLQEEDARFANKQGFSKHTPALPLYTTQDAERAIERLRPLPYEKDLDLNGSALVRFHDAGHVLGSAMLDAQLDLGGNPLRVLFSGDLGRYDALILPDPTPIDRVDYLVVESTYGDRKHPPERTFEMVAEIVIETARRGGMLVVPAFALGRTQTLLYVLRDLKARKMIPDLPIYVDSPMAIHVSRLFCKYVDDLDQDARAVYRSTHEYPTVCPNLHYVETREESKKLNDLRFPAIVISASGMATGGRILHHLKHRLPDPRNTVLFIGFQSSGTRGQLLKDGAKEVKIHGETVPVRAQVRSMESFSGHADSDEIMRWLRAFKVAPRETFIVHGEPESSKALEQQIRSQLGWKTRIPEYLETVTLT